MRLPSLVLPLWLIGCSGSTEILHQFEDLNALSDQGNNACSGEVAGAYGLSDSSVQTSAITARKDILFVFVDPGGSQSTTLLVLDASDPTAIEQISRLQLPGVGWVGATEVTGDLLLASWSRPMEKVVAIDISDPTEPAVVDELVLGSSGEASTFTAHADRVFTDGGDFHYLDLLDGRMQGGTVDGQRPFSSPRVIDGQLYSGDWDGILGDTCTLGIYDIDQDEPVEAERVPLTSCIRSGLAPVDDVVLGMGFRDGLAVVTALTASPEGWSTTELELPWTERLSELEPYGSDALLLGGRDSSHEGLTLLRVINGSPLEVGGWKPHPSSVNDLAVTDTLGWVVMSIENQEFEGIVAIDLENCQP